MFRATTEDAQKQLNKELYEAIFSQDDKALDKAILAGADVNAQGNNEGWGKTEDPPLFEAIGCGYVYGVKKLLQSGADILGRDSKNQSPEYLAIMVGDDEILSAILSTLPRLASEVIGKRKVTLLHAAIEHLSTYSLFAEGDWGSTVSEDTLDDFYCNKIKTIPQLPAVLFYQGSMNCINILLQYNPNLIITPDANNVTPFDILTMPLHYKDRFSDFNAKGTIKCLTEGDPNQSVLTFKVTVANRWGENPFEIDVRFDFSKLRQRFLQEASVKLNYVEQKVEAHETQVDHIRDNVSLLANKANHIEHNVSLVANQTQHIGHNVSLLAQEANHTKHNMSLLAQKSNHIDHNVSLLAQEANHTKHNVSLLAQKSNHIDHNVSLLAQKTNALAKASEPAMQDSNEKRLWLYRREAIRSNKLAEKFCVTLDLGLRAHVTTSVVMSSGKIRREEGNGEAILRAALGVIESSLPIFGGIASLISGGIKVAFDWHQEKLNKATAKLFALVTAQGLSVEMICDRTAISVTEHCTTLFTAPNIIKDEKHAQHLATNALAFLLYVMAREIIKPELQLTEQLTTCFEQSKLFQKHKKEFVENTAQPVIEPRALVFSPAAHPTTKNGVLVVQHASGMNGHNVPTGSKEEVNQTACGKRGCLIM